MKNEGLSRETREDMVFYPFVFLFFYVVAFLKSVNFGINSSLMQDYMKKLKNSLQIYGFLSPEIEAFAHSQKKEGKNDMKIMQLKNQNLTQGTNQNP